jgi:uncharacterized protein YbbC (DUF1343 family)
LRFGADRLAAEPTLLGNVGKVALATNDAARSAADVDLRTRSLLHSAGVPIVRLFSPEHGLSAQAADGAAVPDATDELTGLPIVSLYGDRFAPSTELLADIDAVLFDVPDVGARFYTYTWTLTHLVDACARARLPLFVLDRPNPLGGTLDRCEGPLLEPACASFIGRHTIPIRHSLTLGEIAMLWRNEQQPDADVRVIACEGWQREQLWPDTGLPFVPTSPAITTFQAALLYPGLCLFEATNLSVGRGSGLSFQAVGAPWLDAGVVRDRFRSMNHSGIEIDCAEMVPSTGPWAGERCSAVQLTGSDFHAARPVRAGLALLAIVMATHRDRFAWARYPTAANPTGSEHFERLVGVRGVREQLVRAPESVGAPLLSDWTTVPGWALRWRSVVNPG